MWEWIKNKWIIGGILFLIGEIALRIYSRFLNLSWNYILALSISLSDWIFIIGIIIGVIFIIIGLKSLYPKVEMIDKLQAYIFFPKGTPTENQTLEHHNKLPARRKLIINFKTNPPKAYYLPNDVHSYGWRLINKYQNMWISELYPHSELESRKFTEKWCTQKGYTLIKLDATKDDLLEKD